MTKPPSRQSRPTPAPGTAALPRRAALLLPLAALSLSGCSLWDDWFGSDKPPIPGTRIAIDAARRGLAVDKAAPKIVLPAPATNADWPQAGGVATHDMEHPALGPAPSRAWSASIGAGGGYRERITAHPIVAGGRIYTMDSDAAVSAFDTSNGNRIWRTETQAEGDRSSNLGGGISIDGKTIYVGTGRGDVLTLDAATGTIGWRQKLTAAARCAPTVTGDRMLVNTIDGQLLALANSDGHKLWSYQATQVTTAVLGLPAPAVSEGVAVAGFAAGDLAAVRTVSGSVSWTDSLAAARGRNSLADLSTITGMPVIRQGRVYVGSVGGLLVALDLRTGRRLWEREVATTETPWVAGEWLFILSTDGRLAAISREEGNVAWVIQLDTFENPEKKRGPISWMGPVLAGGRLIVVGSTSVALSFDPMTGKPLGSQDLPDVPSLPPIVAAGTIYFVTDDATLTAFR